MVTPHLQDLVVVEYVSCDLLLYRDMGDTGVVPAAFSDNLVVLTMRFLVQTVSLMLMAPILFDLCCLLERNFEQEKLPERRLLGVCQAEGRRIGGDRQQPHFRRNVHIVSGGVVSNCFVDACTEY